MDSGRWDAGDYRIPESFSAFCSIVSLTAAKTRRMFEVSVACVRLEVLVMDLGKRAKGPHTEDIS
jgi:hypothetical protein